MLAGTDVSIHSRCGVSTSRYEIRLRGRLTKALLAEFSQLSLDATVEPVETVLYGPVTDQAALYGLLRRIEALGLELVEVRRVPSASAASQPD
jgi:hypothetical protein